MAKSLFDHVNAVYQTKDIHYYDKLDDADKKSFNVYMINRFVSMVMDYIPAVNEIQQYWGQIGPRESFLFYSQLLPRKKTFAKYVKKAKAEKYEPWLIDLTLTKYQCSITEANNYLKVFYSSAAGAEHLRSICEGFGIDSKRLKKAGL